MEEKQNEAEEALLVPESLPVLPLRDIVIFPFMIVPLYVSRDKSVKAVDFALADNRMICLVAQKDQDRETPSTDDLHRMGTVAVIMRMLKLPDGRIRVLVKGMNRAQVDGFRQDDPYFLADLTSV